MNHVKSLLKKYIPDLYYDLGTALFLAKGFAKHYLPVLLRNGATEAPHQIRIESSSICNLRCQHCPTGTWSNQQHNFRGLMDPELFDSLVGQLRQIPQIQGACLYLGGEALVNKQLPDMLARLKRETHVKRTWLSTNGMLLTEEMGRRLLEAGIDKLAVSIDGRSPEDNDALRLGARYETVRDNALRFKAMAEGRPVQVRIDNCVVAYAGEFADYVLPPVPEFIRRDFPGFVHNALYAKRWPLIETDKSSYAEMRFARWRGYKAMCLEPFKEICVRANGDVVPCCQDLTSHHVLGNAKEQSLMEIWNGAPYRNLRKSLATAGLLGELPRMCRECVIHTKQILVAPRPLGG